jgi:hypothetical protein
MIKKKRKVLVEIKKNLVTAKICHAEGLTSCFFYLQPTIKGKLETQTKIR